MNAMMVQSDLYIHGPQAQRHAIVQMLMGIAQRMGIDTADESALNIPMGMVMEVLVGDGMHIGLLIGLNTEDPECVVQTTLEEMRQAFPCDKLNQYYSGRYYQDLFYPSCPDTIDEGGYEILQYTAGKHIGKEARAKWDFYLDADQLLPIEGGSKRAMCVKFWRKRDFESLAEWVSQKYKFIDVQKCL